MSRALLAIIDGFGIAKDPNVSAIDQARKPFIDSLFKEYPHTTLTASGEAVGLPEGQFGNSEVGHLNIGAGRIVWQELTRVNKSIREGYFFSDKTLLQAAEDARKTGRVHIMGLFSDGGVHSHNNHLFALLKLFHDQKVGNVYVHAFTDGRDTSPNGGIKYAGEFNRQAAEIGTGRIASVIGRYYAMDRDKRWERVKKAYDLLINGIGEQFETAEQAFEASYKNDVTDEFILPCVIGDSDESRIRKGDTVIFYNIRGDRARQITTALTDPEFSEFQTAGDLDLNYYTFTSYDSRFRNARVVYPPLNLINTLGEVVSKNGMKQLRIAETEKYPHVTYFFNGGDEEPNKGEERIMIQSPRVATYDLQPEMSAPEVARTLSDELAKEKFDLVILNFANPDMVGHTGVFEAAVKAVETIDEQLRLVLETALKHGYKAIVIADHGNADCMVQEDGSAHTAHTTAPVPFILVDPDRKNASLVPGILADVAPSLLKLLDVGQPGEMTGKPLF
ncbi:MAG: 2,3-bisphosphoglycerate-independent phosphoglycerate mutase [Cyclonatronaceae bacterium]